MNKKTAILRAYNTAVKYDNLSATPTSSEDTIKILSNKLFFLGILYNTLSKKHLINNHEKHKMRVLMKNITIFLMSTDPKRKDNPRLAKDIDELLHKYMAKK